MSDPNLIFIYQVLPGIILCTGVISNLAGIVVTIRNKRLSSRLIYHYIFTVDLINMILLAILYAAKFNSSSNSMNLRIQSASVCKAIGFLTRYAASLSPWLLVYKSLEKLFSIKYPTKRFDLRKNIYKIIYFACLVLANLIYYIPILNDYRLVKMNETNETMCTMMTAYDTIDLALRFYVPSLILFVVSCFLVKLILKMSKRRIWDNFTHNENKSFKRDVKLAGTSVSLNLLFWTLNLPYAVYSYLSRNDMWYNLTIYISYASFSYKFFIILAMNPYFRKEFTAKHNHNKRHSNAISVIPDE